jgi:acid phosphatase family membrane protein YuiD
MDWADKFSTGQLGSITDFFQNPIILSAVTSWFLAQLIKMIVALLSSGKKKSWKDLFATVAWRTGGMPSSHAATTASLATAVAFTDGLGSDLFALSIFFALVVMRDAMGVRRSSGLQARSLNYISKIISEKLGMECHPVKEVQGHTPLEVAAGCLLGVLIAGAVFFL